MMERDFDWKRMLLAAAFLLVMSISLRAQTRDTVVRGTVTDPTGAVVPAVTVTLASQGGAALTAQTNDRGEYIFRHLPAGTYTVEINVKGFQSFRKTDITVANGQTAVVDAQLVVALEKQKVTVEAQANRLSLSSENNASALVLKGEDLNALSDDPDELQSELQALAGPSAGPNGGQIYIDGFTGGQLPPKSAILEVRVNQNPFSAEYDRLGYGRIEITTKPGYTQWHGQSFVMFNDDAFNARNPFATSIPPYHTVFFDGNVGGPLGKKASFFVDGGRRNIQDSSIVNAITGLDANSNAIYTNASVFTPRTRTEISPRFDFQLGKNNVLTTRYQLEKNDETNTGVGQFNLQSLAYDSTGTENSIQVSDTQVVSARTVNQTRFRYRRETNQQTPFSLDPTIRVVGAFTGGGNSGGLMLDTVKNYEFHNITSFAFGKHSLAVGGRLRDSVDSNNSQSGFNGTFTFPGITQYLAAQQTLQACAGQPGCQAAGASQVSLTTGVPLTSVSLFDMGLYAQDDWRVRPKISLSLGLRYEMQTDISDHADWAPRIGLAWGLGKGAAPKTVLRAGSGVFYDRFGEGQVLEAERLNGLTQKQYILASPGFFANNLTPAGILADILAAGGGTLLPTHYQIDRNLRAPYTIQSAVGLERQVTKTTTVSVTYLNAHGIHQLLTRNINAPLPPTYSTKPDPAQGNVFQFESDGLFNQNQIIANYNVRAGAKLSLFGFYSLSFANSDTGGVNSFPMNSYDIRADYGRAPFDVRHRMFLGGTFSLMRGFRLSPFMMANSGAPYNIAVGQDLNGDSIFNDRPGLVASTPVGCDMSVVTKSSFDSNPAAGETILGPNFGCGPGQFSLNMRVAKTFGFGEKKGESSRGGMFGGGPRGGGDHGGGLGGRGLSGGGGGGGFWGGQPTNRRYNLEFSLMAHNAFNHVNLGTPVGSLSSPLFGHSNSIAGGFFSSQAANRRLDLSMRFTF